VHALSWFWIALELTAVPFAALLVAYPFWRKEQFIFGNIVATAVLFACGIALILREHVELDRIVQACLEAGNVCWPEPSAFTRFAVYAGIALVEVFAFFSASLWVEQRWRSREYAPEWRR
jgi:hypothetical protein